MRVPDEFKVTKRSLKLSTTLLCYVTRFFLIYFTFPIAKRLQSVPESHRYRRNIWVHTGTAYLQQQPIVIYIVVSLIHYQSRINQPHECERYVNSYQSEICVLAGVGYILLAANLTLRNLYAYKIYNEMLSDNIQVHFGRSAIYRNTQYFLNSWALLTRAATSKRIIPRYEGRRTISPSPNCRWMSCDTICRWLFLLLNLDISFMSF